MSQTIRNNLKDPDVLSLNDDVVKDMKKMDTLKETHGCSRLNVLCRLAYR
ncbi:MAG: hypothetical protein QXQ65_02680 [Conexivisphaerales archaeon]